MANLTERELTREQKELVKEVVAQNRLQDTEGWNAATFAIFKAIPRTARKAATLEMNHWLNVQIQKAIDAGQAVLLSHSNSGQAISIITLEWCWNGFSMVQMLRQRFMVNRRVTDGQGDSCYELNHPMVGVLEWLYEFSVAKGQEKLGPAPERK